MKREVGINDFRRRAEASSAIEYSVFFFQNPSFNAVLVFIKMGPETPSIVFSEFGQPILVKFTLMKD